MCDGKPPSYHDITDFVSRDRVEEQVIAGDHDGTQVIIKTGGIKAGLFWDYVGG